MVLGSSEITDPVEHLEQLARASRLQWETGAEVTAIYSAASAADPEAANELAEALAGRRKNLTTFAHSLTPFFKSGLSVEQAASYNFV